MVKPLLAQIPAYQSFYTRWKDITPQPEVVYCQRTGRVDQHLCAVDVSWPDFIEKEGFVLRSIPGKTPENVAAWRNERGHRNWNDSQVEYSLNHLHITDDLFSEDPASTQINLAVFVALAETSAEMWRARLQQLFPQKQCVVEVAGQADLPEVYAYTKRDDEAG